MWLSKIMNAAEEAWGNLWAWRALAAALLLILLLHRSAVVAPTTNAGAAGAATATATARGGRQVVYIPVPGGTVTVYQDCPEVSAAAGATVTVYVESKCPTIPAVMLGWEASYPWGASVDLTFRLGGWYIGPGIGWRFPGFEYQVRAQRPF